MLHRKLEEEQKRVAGGDYEHRMRRTDLQSNRLKKIATQTGVQTRVHSLAGGNHRQGSTRVCLQAKERERYQYDAVTDKKEMNVHMNFDNSAVRVNGTNRI